MSEYTPETWEIRQAYMRMIWRDGMPESTPTADFDRWLNQERQAAFLQGAASLDGGQWWPEKLAEHDNEVSRLERDRLAKAVWEEKQKVFEAITKDPTNSELIAYQSGLWRALDIIEGKNNK